MMQLKCYYGTRNYKISISAPCSLFMMTLNCVGNFFSYTYFIIFLILCKVLLDVQGAPLN